mmetsp:Transcript_467/g.797  ORF Transcript_467/g.797 Transcript_467/m.797 type:complete len:155 (+) Transcript_467:352-816(+)
MALRCQLLQLLEAPNDALAWVKGAIDELNTDPKCSLRWKKVLMGAKEGPKAIKAVICGKDQFLQGGPSSSVQYGQVYGPNGWMPPDQLSQEYEGGRGNRGRGGRGGRGRGRGGRGGRGGRFEAESTVYVPAQVVRVAQSLMNAIAPRTSNINNA